MGNNVPESTMLLQRWNSGDEKALQELLRLHLPWIQTHVRQRLGGLVRAKEETTDVVQDALVEFLRYGPRFNVSNEAHLRFLLGRIAENVLRDRHDFFTRRRRQVARERPLPEESVLELDGGSHDSIRPDRALEKKQWQAWVRLALELMEPEDRETIVLRQWDELEFAEIATKMGTTPDAARMRFQRALPKLAQKIQQLQRGELADLAVQAD
ncbi:MAG TPA: RNA polymerase sigma factor [Planctomycetota bacterium]|nr:RNA polymerase sigma factor [Planctomycetota bacterium]